MHGTPLCSPTAPPASKIVWHLDRVISTVSLSVTITVTVRISDGDGISTSLKMSSTTFSTLKINQSLSGNYYRLLYLLLNVKSWWSTATVFNKLGNVAGISIESSSSFELHKAIDQHIHEVQIVTCIQVMHPCHVLERV